MYDGCYGESARPPWQPADLLIELCRLGQRLERLGASPHRGLLCRQIDQQSGQLPGIVEVPVER